MLKLAASSTGERILEDLTKATKNSLGDRVLLTAERGARASAFKPEYIVIAASEKNVYPLGGKEFSVHTALYQSAGRYLFIEGSYGLTLDRAYAEFAERTTK